LILNIDFLIAKNCPLGQYSLGDISLGENILGALGWCRVGFFDINIRSIVPKIFPIANLLP